jgi:methylmalonyl-CoA/ethylmalonyl-CoA epimerase
MLSEGRMKLVQVGQHAEDLERARRFYAALLEREASAVYDPPGLVFFDLDGVRLLLDRALPSSVVYLGVDDIAAAVPRACAAGAVLEAEPHPIFSHEDDRLGPARTVEWHAFVKDTEGNLVGLVEQRRG